MQAYRLEQTFSFTKQIIINMSNNKLHDFIDWELTSTRSDKPVFTKIDCYTIQYNFIE